MIERESWTERDMQDVSDNPKWTRDEVKSAKPFAAAFPEMAEAIRKRGPAKTKEALSIRLDIDLVERLRATGPGWQSRVNDALRNWLDKAP